MARPKKLVNYYISLCAHHRELMKSAGSCSSSLLFMMKVTVCLFKSDSLKVLTALIVMSTFQVLLWSLLCNLIYMLNLLYPTGLADSHWLAIFWLFAAGNVCRYWQSFWGIEDRKRWGPPQELLCAWEEWNSMSSFSIFGNKKSYLENEWEWTVKRCQCHHQQLGEILRWQCHELHMEKSDDTVLLRQQLHGWTRR